MKASELQKALDVLWHAPVGIRLQTIEIQATPAFLVDQLLSGLSAVLTNPEATPPVQATLSSVDEGIGQLAWQDPKTLRLDLGKPSLTLTPSALLKELERIIEGLEHHAQQRAAPPLVRAAVATRAATLRERANSLTGACLRFTGAPITRRVPSSDDLLARGTVADLYRSVVGDALPWPLDGSEIAPTELPLRLMGKAVSQLNEVPSTRAYVSGNSLILVHGVRSRSFAYIASLLADAEAHDFSAKAVHRELLFLREHADEIAGSFYWVDGRFSEARA